jgi:hypothetical protein
MLGWLTPDGCFAFKLEYGPDGEIELPSAHLRVRRAEREMEHGCLSHATGVGVVTMSMYLRYIMEDIYPVFSGR